jgi:hypothetical protein
MRTWARWLWLGLLSVSWAAPSSAYFLDKDRNFAVRARVYTQVGIMADDSETDSPHYRAGDLAQHRNFYNPEFDARLTDYTRWARDVPGLSFISPDDFKFRFAWWGFYDGIYDYLNPEWNDRRRAYQARFSETDKISDTLHFNDQNKNPRHIYASRNRINELYFDYTKGRVFIRAGRQAISWGEADTIALLDVQNPFDLTLGAPGFYQDVDEARIPLWTLRSTVKIADKLGPMSSFFADAYVVPGVIDTTVPIDPITAGVSPFNPDVMDPQLQLKAANQQDALHIIVASRQPAQTWSNTRWGARLTSLLFRDYTVQAWFFRTFNQAPVPILHSPGSLQLNLDGKLQKTFIDDRGFRVAQCLGTSGPNAVGHTPAGRRCSAAFPIVSLLERRLESVVGLSATWFNSWLNGIIRTEMEYFIDELAFIPEKNLNPQAEVPAAVHKAIGTPIVSTSLPKADFLRFVLGYDRFFFFRPLNPTNSFVVSLAFNGQLNLSEIAGHGDYRYLGSGKPGKPQAQISVIPGSSVCTPKNVNDPSFAKTNPLAMACAVANPKNFEDLYPFEGFLQTAVQTDYMHGKLSPRLVIITDVSGIFGFAPTATYRITDNFLLTGTYLAIEGSRRAGLANFRGHDMVQLRLTYQLN